MNKNTIYTSTLAKTADYLYKTIGPNLNLGCPLGLGKPNALINEIYNVAAADTSKTLNIYTALSLSVPKPKSLLEKRFLQPFLERHFGKDYPELSYIQAQKKGALPSNINVIEFYMQSGSMLGVDSAQRTYVSLNYTHVAQTLIERDVHAIVQMIAEKKENGISRYSLSCNSDLTLDLYDLAKNKNKKLVIIGVIHPDLPFMGGDAEVDANFFDVVTSTKNHQLFALPILPIDYEDHAIGFHASQMIKDDGTLQIGIGSLSDALVHSTILRATQNDFYKKLVVDFPIQNPELIPETSTFVSGLYGTSEMIMDGFMHLRKAGVLKREIFESDKNIKRYLHGAFFLGSKKFYQWLRNLSAIDYQGINMTRVSLVNDLYDENEMAIRRQRKHARFFNTCMQVSLLGGAASDTLPTGQVVSGIGGQYNFVAMSHELMDAYSILMLRSTRTKNGKRMSNIVWTHEQLSIPRHLRDVVITEYGIAHLRGKTDEETIVALLNITDSEFQENLLQIAKNNGKIKKNYKIPKQYTNNNPKAVKDFIESNSQTFPPYPFGSDFTPVEERLSLVLSQLKELQKIGILKLLVASLLLQKDIFKAELDRLDLFNVKSVKEYVFQRLILGILHHK